MAVNRDWPLVGRSRELRSVDVALRHGGAVLAGAAGVGKTRLARETIAEAARRGCRTHWIAASASARTLPFGAFAGLVDIDDSVPLHVVPQIIDALVGGRKRDDVVIAVDDAHHLDPLSCFVVHQIAAQELATLVVTVRTGEPAPQEISALWRSARLPRLDIEPLTEAQTTELVTAVLGAPVDSPTARRLWELTDGNALYLRQLVDGQVASDTLRLEGGRWQLHGDPILSASVVELVEARMSGLAAPVGEVVDLLAIGEPLDAALLAELTAPGAVEDAEGLGLVSVSGSGVTRLAHPLYGEVRRSRLGNFRTRRLRGKLAVALAGGAETPAQLLRRAVLHAASDRAGDPELFTAAARAAFAVLDTPLAERLARAGLDAGAGPEARILHAWSLVLLGRGEEAEKSFARLMESVQLTVPERADIAVLRTLNLAFVMRDRLDQATALLRAPETVRADPEYGVALGVFAEYLRSHFTLPLVALDAAQAVLDTPELSDMAHVQAAISYVLSAGYRGRCDSIATATERGYALAGQSTFTAYLVFPLGFVHLNALRLAGDIVGAAAVSELIAQRCSDLPGTSPAMIAMLHGNVALGRGAIRTAAKLFDEALTGFDATQHRWAMVCGLGQAYVRALAGDAGGADAELDRLDAEWQRTFVHFDAEILLARAWAAAARGAMTDALTKAHEAAATAVAAISPAVEVLALQTIVRFGDASVADRLAVLAEQVDGPRAVSAAAHARALRDGDGDALAAVSRRYNQMGDRCAAIDAAAQASTAYTAAGRRGSALTMCTQAQRIAETCAVTTPALAEAVQPVPLTRRERETATLAARGLSNKQIAEQLFVSVRTVEGHLYRVTSKLGGIDRADLPRILLGEN